MICTRCRAAEADYGFEWCTPCAVPNPSTVWPPAVPIQP